MSKMNEMQSYFINNNLSMSNVELHRITGLSTAQIARYRNKLTGLNREGKPKGTEELNVPVNPNREAELIQKSQEVAEATGNLLPVEGRPVPELRMDALMARKSGTVSLTKAAAELGDIFDGIAPGSKPMVPRYDPFSDESRVHKIKR